MAETDNSLDTVSIIIPVYNEELYITNCINSILQQDYKNIIEIILIDGMSSDNTKEIIKKFIEEHPHIKLLENPDRQVQFALNIGIKNAVGKFIVRMDAHADFAPDYVSQSIKYIKETNAFDVGGPTIAKGRTPFAQVVAAAFHSPFALGGGKQHDENYCGYSDTVFAGTFRRQELIDIGLYDERFSRTEDDELCMRATMNGKKIFITPDIKSTYYPRASLKKLAKQYFGFGLMKPMVMKKHKRPARITQIIPALFVLYLIIGAVLSFLSPVVACLYVAVFGLYLLLDIFFSFKNKKAGTFIQKIQLVFVHFVMHISYGTGYLIGFFRFYLFNEMNL